MERNRADSGEVRTPLERPLWELVAGWGEPDAKASGEILIAENKESTDLMLVESGELEISTSDGSRIRLQAPTLVGEQSLLSGRPTNARVTTCSPVRFRRVAPDRFREMAVRDPQGLALLQGLMRVTIDRLQGRFHLDPYVALIAHDELKQDLIDLAREHVAFLGRQALLCTRHTGERLGTELGLHPARVVSSGPFGGDQEVGALVVAGLVRAVLFFPDPLSSQPHTVDVQALLRLCDVHRVPVATNRGTGHHLLRSLKTEHQ